MNTLTQRASVSRSSKRKLGSADQSAQADLAYRPRISIRGAAATVIALLLVTVSSAGQNRQPTPIQAAECRRAEGLVRLDGRLDEPAWEKAQSIRAFIATRQGRAPKTATTARLLWDDRYLYMAAEMEDSDLYADVLKRNGMTWTNDVIELFLKPSKESLRYYEFQVNPANTPLELDFPSRGAGGYQRFASTTRLGMASAVRLDGTLNRSDDDDRGWTVELRIPWTAFKERPQPGSEWRFAVCRYDYSKAFERPELSSIADLPGDFHAYEFYPALRFIGP